MLTSNENFKPARPCLLILLIFMMQYFIFVELALAQLTEDNEPPIILHLPVTTSLRGQAIFINARVADNSEVKNVTVNFKKGGRFLDVPLDMEKTINAGAVKLKVVSEAAYVFSNPSIVSDTLATVTRDEVFAIYEEDITNWYYHIKINELFNGWIKKEDAKPVMSGHIYVGVIPAFITMTSEVVYRIAAEDISFNKISTPNYRVKIIDPANQSSNTKEPPVPKDKIKTPTVKPFYASGWFWGTVAVAASGAGVYFYLQQREKKGNIDVEVQW